MALLQSSWPSHSHFHSNVDRYDTKMELYASDHHEHSSSITTITHENSSSVSSVDLPMLSNDYDHGHYGIHNSLVNIEGLDDVCKWLCDDVKDQRMDESSICVHDDAMEIDSQTRIENILMAYKDAM